MKTTRYTQATLTVIAISLCVIAVNQTNEAEARKHTNKLLPITGTMKKPVYIECNTLKGGELPHLVKTTGEIAEWLDHGASLCELTFYNKGARYTIDHGEITGSITRDFKFLSPETAYGVRTGGTPYSKPKPKSKKRNK